MPVEFLTREQELAYGRYNGEPSITQLARYFHLDDHDHQLIAARRNDTNRLGFALQLCTVRFLGTFLTNPLDVPPGPIAYLAGQLQIEDSGCLFSYMDRRITHHDHANEIKTHYAYSDFNDRSNQIRLLRWLFARTLLNTERPSLLFDLTTAWLVERKILLPGVTTLAELIARVRERSAIRLYRMMTRTLTEKQRTSLESLLIVPKKSQQSAFDRLRRSPVNVTSNGMDEALKRLIEIRELGVGQIDLSKISTNRMMVLARYAANTRAQTIERLSTERRLATLLAFARALEITAQDDALNLLEQLTRTLLAKAERLGEKTRIKTLKELDQAALQVAQACEVILDPNVSDEQIRSNAYKRVSAETLQNAIAVISALSKPPDDNYYEQLRERYNMVRHFLPLLLSTINFSATKTGKPVVEALAFLKGIEGKRNPSIADAPQAVVNRVWHPLVFQNKHHPHDRRAYTFCVLERLQESLSKREVYVEPSHSYGDPRAKLLQGEAWVAVRPKVCLSLGHSLDAHTELEKLGEKLDAAYLKTAGNLDDNKWVRIEQKEGKDRPILTPLEKLVGPESLIQLQKQTNGRLPDVDIGEALLEIALLTGFAKEFTHVSENRSRVDDLELSICAVLIAEACNIGFEPLINPSIPALTQSRLSWVQQNYIREETISRANACLVEAQSKMELAQLWGGGEVASADGMRFVVPVKTVNAGFNSEYFAKERGITFYNLMSDQFSGMSALVIPGTLRDSLHLLELVLNQPTTLKPTEIMTDTAGSSDIVFGLFYMMKIVFSPQLADLGDIHYWRLDDKVDYGSFQQMSQHYINKKLINQNWDDILRITGSLMMGTVNPTELMRTLQRGKRASTIARAIGELGRVVKTLFLLNYLDDENYRRRIKTQLNRGEGRHALARAIAYGKRGELRQRYREGQEDQLGALGLVLNILVLWNTQYLNEAVKQLRRNGIEPAVEDLARLSPLGFKHINMLGRYQMVLEETVKKGNLRPLRNLERIEE